MNQKYFIGLAGFLLYFLSGFVQAQTILLQDDFSDGNFTANPVWSGSSTQIPGGGFAVTAARLQTNIGNGGTGTRMAWLSTPFVPDYTASYMEWHFVAGLNFAASFIPNDTNHARIFVLSSSANVDGTLQGYFVRIQERVSLWRQSGNVIEEIPLFSGAPFLLTSPVANLNIRLTRHNDGVWRLYARLPGHSEETFLGYGADETFRPVAAWFGVHYRYSANERANQFNFDDLQVRAINDTQPLELLSISGKSARQLRLNFNKAIDFARLTQARVYVDQGVGNLLGSLPAGNDRSIFVRFGNNLQAGIQYELSAEAFTDASGNMLPLSFQSFIFQDEEAPLVTQVSVSAPNALNILCDEAVQAAAAQNLANYVLSGNTVAAALRDAQNPALIRLFFTNNFPENTRLSLQILNLTDTAGNARSLSVGFERDTRRPTIGDNDWQIPAPNQILLIFSEALDKVSAETVNHYQITGIGFPLSARQDPNSPERVLLTFSANLPLNTNLPLRIVQVRDLSGNIITTRTLQIRYDPDKPRLVGLRTRNNLQGLALTFSEPLEQVSAELLSNYELIPPSGEASVSIGSASLCQADATWVFLNLNAPLTAGQWTLRLRGMLDLAGNIKEEREKIFDTSPLRISSVQVLSPDSIVVAFSKIPEQTQAENLSRYQLAGIGLRNPTRNASRPWEVGIGLTQPMQAGGTYNLQIADMLAEDGSPMDAPAQLSFSYRTHISLVEATAPNVLEVRFSEAPAASELSNRTRYWLNQNQTLNPVAAIPDSNDPLLLRLVFAEAFEPERTYTLHLDAFGLTCERTLPGSIHTFSFDDRPPRVLSVRVRRIDELEITLSKVPERSSAEALNHYQISGMARPLQASQNGRTVVLRLSERLRGGISYNLQVSNVRDLQGNTMPLPQTLAFARPEQPRAGELVISEIFADPTPRVGLPEIEYIELHNTTSRAFDLSGMRYADGSTRVFLDNINIGPGEYLILAPRAQADSFRIFGRTEGLSPWIALTNSGKTLYLLDMDSVVIETVAYSDTWYGDALKRQGGWSLELIDALSRCAGVDNWAASIDPRGGTPGTANSVAALATNLPAPRIASLQVTDERTLQLRFSATPDSVAAVQKANYQMEGLEITSIKWQSLREVHIATATPIDSTKVYRLIINNIANCRGMARNDTATFGIGRRVRPGELVINEIMANEVLPGGSDSSRVPVAEYIEIVNRTSDALALGSLNLRYQNSAIRLPQRLVLPGQYLVLCANARASLFSGIAVQGVTSFPTLANSGASLSLSDTSGWLIEQVNYSDTWYGDAIKRQGGWSLERISTDIACHLPATWSASVSPRGGTPGLPNSIAGRSIVADPPRVLSVNLRSPQEIVVTFSQEMDTLRLKDLQAYVLEGGGIAAVQVNSARQVILRTAAALPSQGEFVLRISNLNDCLGVALPPFSVRLAQGREAHPFDVLISEIMAREVPVVGLPAVEYIELYNRSGDFISLRGLRLSDATGVATLPDAVLPPETYVVLCATSRVDSFSRLAEPPRVLGVSGFPSLNNTGEPLTIFRQADGQVIHRVEYRDSWYRDAQKRLGGWSLEMIDTENFCAEETNWIASVDPLGGTPGRRNSVAATLGDTLPPRVESALFIAANLLEIRFNKAMDTLRLAKAATYRLETGISIGSIGVQPDRRSVQLTWLNPPDSSRLYVIVLNDLTDCEGNLLLESRIETGIGQRPQPYELIITEIMADPTPVVGLPEREFIEIYNRSTKLIQLSTVWLSDDNNAASGGIRLPAGLLRPYEYVVLCANSAVADLRAALAPQAQVIGVASFPSLNNSGENLVLRTAWQTIFSVTYSDTWYADPLKRQGGWTLEMIDTEYACVEAGNWTASVDPSGGTPGRLNSVAGPNPDTDAPQLSRVQVLSPRIVVLTFNEAIDSLSLTLQARFTLSGLIGVRRVWIEKPDELLIETDQDLQTAQVYTLTLSGLSDCSGNTMPPTTVSLGLGRSPGLYEVLITELMADPTPVVNLPESEYIELYNNTDQIISLGGSTLQSTGSPSRLPALTVLPRSYLLLCPSASVAHFQRQFPSIQVVALSPWTTLPNAGGTLRLRNDSGQMVARVDYSSQWYKDPEKRDGGWSLEMIDLRSPCLDAVNWEASLHPQGGTPGRANSHTTSVLDTRPPVLQQVQAADSLRLLLRFDEKLDSTSVVGAEYRLSSTDIRVAAVHFSPEQPSQVLLTLTQPLRVRTSYTLSVARISDCSGNTAFSVQNSRFVLPELPQAGDLLLNEVLFNPATGGADFAELVNVSAKYLNIAGCVLFNAQSGVRRTVPEAAQSIVPPRGYVVLTNSPASLRWQYPKGADSTYLEMPLPAFNNASGNYSIASQAGELLDTFDYTERMHFRLIDDRKGVTLERISLTAPGNDPSNWFSAAAPYFGTPGYLNSQSRRDDERSVFGKTDCFRIEDQVFTPDGDGFQDFLKIYYDCGGNGIVANAWVYNMQGRPVRRLLQQFMLSPGNFAIWDGLDDKGSKVPVGYYVIHVELFDLQGQRRQVQLKAVVGARFR